MTFRPSPGFSHGGHSCKRLTKESTVISTAEVVL